MNVDIDARGFAVESRKPQMEWWVEVSEGGLWLFDSIHEDRDHAVAVATLKSSPARVRECASFVLWVKP